MGKLRMILGICVHVSLSICLLLVIASDGHSTGSMKNSNLGNPSNYLLDINKSNLSNTGRTILLDSADPNNPSIVEIDMEGKIIWFYAILKSILKGCDLSKGPDIEWLPGNNNILFVLPNKGIYEINRQKKTVWKYKTDKVSHDADRLPNGNTLYVWGWDRKNDPQAVEINSEGKIVWKWFAKDHLANESRPRPFKANLGGYYHANSAMRLDNGNTLISLKEFDMVVEVIPAGDIVWSLKGMSRIHDPQLLENGNILLATNKPFKVIELSREGEIIWSFQRNDIKAITYCCRLPNGNTLLVARNKIIEISPGKEIVWQITNKNVPWEIDPKITGKKRLKEWVKLRHRWFYKAERLPLNN